MPTPLILDFDASLPTLQTAQRLDLQDWQERIRFGCGSSVWRALDAHLSASLPKAYGTVCLGSGDYHHLSHLLIKRIQPHEKFDVLVLDNHPDNMRFPFGIHCGSWVKHIAQLPQVGRIDVAGITSGDIGLAHAWENHLLPLYRSKVRYWSTGVKTQWAKCLGIGQSVRSFPDSMSMLEALTADLNQRTAPVYLSIDKDVLSPEEVHTNWDQGCMRLEEMFGLIETLRGKIMGSDITGEVSTYHYLARWKQFLSGLDGQPEIAADKLQAWQLRHAQVNTLLIEKIAQSARG